MSSAAVVIGASPIDALHNLSWDLTFVRAWLIIIPKLSVTPFYLERCINTFFITGFLLTPYLESFTPTFGTPVFPRMSSNLHCGTPTSPKRCLWDSYFQNPSENPVSGKKMCEF